VSASVLYMSMSLDGYIAGPNDGPGNPGGDGFIWLHEWGLTPDGEHRTDGTAGQFNDEYNATGAIVVGRRSRLITGAAIPTAAVCRSSCPVTGRPARRSRTIRW
jgi:hypothetical protein